MLFTCLPEGAQIPGRFPGPVHARGKWFTIDIHCHLLTVKAEEMVAERRLSMDWQPRHQFANELNSRDPTANRPAAPAFSSPISRPGSPTWTAWGSTSRRSPRRRLQTFYSVPPDLGIATARVVNDNIAEICGKNLDRFVGLGTVPFQAPEPAVAELDRLHKSLGLRGIEIATNVAGADLSEPRFRPIFARAEELGLELFMPPTGLAEAQPFPRPYSRTSSAIRSIGAWRCIH